LNYPPNQMIDKNIVVSKSLIDYCVNPCDVDRLEKLADSECRQILPFLTRIWSRTTNFDAHQLSKFKFVIYEKIRVFEDTNRIREYLDADFSQIYEDVIRHLSTRLG
jgi:hypothetical protein